MSPNTTPMQARAAAPNARAVFAWGAAPGAASIPAVALIERPLASAFVLAKR